MAQELEMHEHAVSPAGRVSRSLLRQRWPEFFVELVLIIVGILAALAIDGWMQGRQDRKLEKAYLELLHQDLFQVENALQRYVDFETANMHTAAAAYEAVAAKNLPGDVEKLQELIGGLSARRTLRIVSGAYTDLTSTGNLQLIRRAALREGILEYFAEAERVETVIGKNNDVFIDDNYLSFLTESGMAMNWSKSPEPLIVAADDLVQGVLGGKFELPRAASLSLPPEHAAWDNVRHHVLLRMRTAAVGAVIGGGRIEATRELRAEIEAELQNPI